MAAAAPEMTNPDTGDANTSPDISGFAEQQTSAPDQDCPPTEPATTTRNLKGDTNRFGDRPLLTLGLVLAVVALAATGMYQLVSVLHTRSQLAGQEQALATARQAAVNLTTVSPTTAAQDLQRVIAGATGTFRDQYAQQEKTIDHVITASQVTSTSQANSAGLVSYTSDSAVALVAISANVRNKQTPNGQPRAYRMRITLKRTNADWLVSSMEFVP
jgi:Mce-associated membrane protein